MRSTLMAAVLVPLAMLAGACNTVTTGDSGVLTFTPDECGPGGCSLDDTLIVGGSTLVTLDDANDRHNNADLSDLTLITDNPGVVDVQVVKSSSFTSSFRVTGVAGGRAHLIAIDRGGYEVDRTDVVVGYADAFDIYRGSKGFVRDNDRAGYDQVWITQASAENDMTIYALRHGDRLMGRFEYHVDIDRVLFDGISAVWKDSLAKGHMVFRVPPGEYPVTFTTPDGLPLRLLIVAK